jgi:hypothetical protein
MIYQLTPRTLRDGAICLRTEIDLLVKINTPIEPWIKIRFIIDTGADVSLIPYQFAIDNGIPVDRDSAAVMTTIAGRVQSYRGRMTVFHEGSTFQWRCYFPQVESKSAIDRDQLRIHGYHAPVCLLGRADVLSRDFDFAVRATSFCLRDRRSNRFRDWLTGRWSP